MRETGVKYKTFMCGRCLEPHSNYTGKLDSEGVEYVVCGSSNKRMNINNEGNIRYWALFPTKWIPENSCDCEPFQSCNKCKQ
jgi:hypothetical protein